MGGDWERSGKGVPSPVGPPGSLPRPTRMQLGAAMASTCVLPYRPHAAPILACPASSVEGRSSDGILRASMAIGGSGGGLSGAERAYTDGSFLGTTAVARQLALPVQVATW